MISVGGHVRTPTGAIAEVMEVYDGIGEVLVQWPSGDRAQFRVSHLRALPGLPGSTAPPLAGRR